MNNLHVSNAVEKLRDIITRGTSRRLTARDVAASEVHLQQILLESGQEQPSPLWKRILRYLGG
jgi:hypothetical protein